MSQSVEIVLGGQSHVCEISMHAWVHLVDHSVYAYKRNGALCQVVFFLETRPELFSGTRTHSSDRTMDLGLAEDHFSRPVVSKAYRSKWICFIS